MLAIGLERVSDRWALPVQGRVARAADNFLSDTLLLSKKQEEIMAQINWIESFDEALYKARAADKLVFADFFSPT